jgi:hypothetical protein
MIPYPVDATAKTTITGRYEAPIPPLRQEDAEVERSIPWRRDINGDSAQGRQAAVVARQEGVVHRASEGAVKRNISGIVDGSSGYR